MGQNLKRIILTTAAALAFTAISTAGAAVPVSPNGWHAQTAPGGLVQLQSVACAGRTNCWAVGGNSGNHGEIAATTNGGASWHLQQVPLTGDLRFIACSSTGHCLVVGDGSNGAQGAALATTNGGGTWQLRRLPQNDHPEGVACEASRCWLAAIAYSAGSSLSGAMLTTTNWGSTWSQQHLPSDAALTGQIACGSKSDCWEIASTLRGGRTLVIGTADSGRSWRTQFSSPTIGLAAISCPSSSRCLVVGGRGSASNLHAVVLATTNRGRSWRSQHLPGGVQGLVGIRCPSTSTCWTIGASHTGRPPYYSLLATVDGGTHWAQQLAPDEGGGLFDPVGGVACSSVTDCWVVGTGDGPVILATTSGGE